MTLTANAPTAPTLTAITLPYSEALLSGLYAVALHTGKNDMSPVVNNVRVNARTLLATDRHSVGRWEHTPGAVEGDFSVLVPRVTAEWLTKQSPKVLGFMGREASISSQWDIVITSTAVTIQWRETGDVLAIQRYAECLSAFPPVDRILNDLTPALDAVPVALMPARVERFTKGATRVLPKDGAYTMTTTSVGTSGKPGPVLFRFGSFKGCLQPNMLH